MRSLLPALLALLASLATLVPAAHAEVGTDAVNKAWNDAWDTTGETYDGLPHPGPTESFPGPRCQDVNAGRDVHLGRGLPSVGAVHVGCDEDGPLLTPRENATPPLEGDGDAQPAATDPDAPAGPTPEEPVPEPADPPTVHVVMDPASPVEAAARPTLAPAVEARGPGPSGGPSSHGIAAARVPDGGPLLVSVLAAASVLVVLPSLLAKIASLVAVRWGRRASAVPAAILALLEREPGLHHTELVRRIGKGHGTVDHHVQRLLKEGRVRRVRTPGFTCYFLAAHADAHAEARLAVRSRTARRLAEAVLRHPHADLSSLAATLGLAVSTAHYHAGRLVRAGLLADARSGGRRAFTLTAAGHACLGSPRPAPAEPSAPAPAPAAARTAG